MVTPMMQCSTLSCGHRRRVITYLRLVQVSLALQISGSHLEEARDVGDDVPEDVLILLTVEPAELGDPGV